MLIIRNLPNKIHALKFCSITYQMPSTELMALASNASSIKTTQSNFFFSYTVHKIKFYTRISESYSLGTDNKI